MRSGTCSSSSNSALGLDFDYDVDAIFNASKVAQSKSEFVKAQENTGDTMYLYSEAFDGSPEVERYFNECINSYFQDCQRKIRAAENENN